MFETSDCEEDTNHATVRIGSRADIYKTPKHRFGKYSIINRASNAKQYTIPLYGALPKMKDKGEKEQKILYA
ncbi:unnamed protein product [Sphenostylis stenocarpa]|uniref:Uncharacterized protein n=1 Tax=Sphenostylis stenocarpa TaxID=92480 RepID=A0AA86W6R6_9FABA|nr:unnamed protein product [Sphenostylis stenocarpa]